MTTVPNRTPIISCFVNELLPYLEEGLIPLGNDCLLLLFINSVFLLLLLFEGLVVLVVVAPGIVKAIIEISSPQKFPLIWVLQV